MKPELRLRRFWARVRRQDGCWLWGGSKNTQGYGVVAGWETGSASRVAWFLMRRSWPDGIIRNKCGHLACVNPAHWREVSKAVSAPQKRKMEIERLFRSGVGIGEIADAVGVSRVTVWRRTHGLVVETAFETEGGTGEGG